MSRDPWIGHPNYSWAYDDDDEESRKEEERRREKRMAEWAAKEREEARRVQARIDAALEPIYARERAELAKEHPVLATGAIVGTALAKLFDGSLF